MTNRRAMELLMIERACVRKGSGMENFPGFGYLKVAEECNRDCAHCELVQKSEELLEMYDKVIQVMLRETETEECRPSPVWKDWQLHAEEEKYSLTI